MLKQNPFVPNLLIPQITFGQLSLILLCFQYEKPQSERLSSTLAISLHFKGIIPMNEREASGTTYTEKLLCLA